MPQAIIDRAHSFAAQSEMGSYSLGGTLKTHGNLTARETLEKVCGGNSVEVPVGFEPPPFLEGKSCVYVLEVPFRSGGARMVYVGETDNLRERINRHRERGDLELDWMFLGASAVPVQGGKSDARRFESILINKMGEAGFNLISVKDGRNSNFGGENE